MEKENFQARYAAKLAELAGVKDGLGKPLDKGIVHAVAILQLAGFDTVGSCEGHADWGLPWPWVDITAPGQPPRWQGEAEARATIKHALKNSRPELGAPDQRGERNQAVHKALAEWRETEKPAEHADYKPWLQKRGQAHYRAYSLLMAWRQTFKQSGPPEVVLNVGRLEVLDAHTATDKLAEPLATHERVARLNQRQQAFAGFIEWLQRYLENDSLPC